MLEKIKKKFSRKSVKGQIVELRNLHTQLDYLGEVLTNKELSLEDYRNLKNKNDEIIKSHVQMISQTEKNIKTTEKEIKRIISQSKNYQRSLSELVDDIEKKKSIIENLENELFKKQREFGEAKSTFNLKVDEKQQVQGIYDTVKSEVAEIQDEINALNLSIEDLIDAKEKIKNEIIELEVTREEFTKDRGAKEDRNIILKEQYQKFLNKRNELVNHIEFLQHVEGDGIANLEQEKKELNELKLEVLQLSQIESGLNQKLQNINDQIYQNKSLIKNISEEIRNKKLNVDNLKEIINLKSKEIEKIKIESRDVRQENELLTILSNKREGEVFRLNNLVRDLSEQIKEDQENILRLTKSKNNLEESENELIVRLSKLEKITNQNQAKIKEVQSVVEEYQARVNEKEKQVSTLRDTLKLIDDKATNKDEVILNWNKQIADLDNQILGLEQDVEVANKKLELDEEKLRALESNIEIKNNELREVTNRLSYARRKSHELDAKINIITNKAVEINNGIDRRISFLKIVNTRIIEKENQVAQLNQELIYQVEIAKDYDLKIQQSLVAKDEVESNYEAVESEVAKIQQQNSNLKNELSELTNLKIKLLSKKANLEQKIKITTQECIDNEQQIINLKKEIKKLEIDSVESDEKYFEVERKYNAIVSKKALLEKEVVSNEETKNRIERGLIEINKSFAETHDEYNKLINELNYKRAEIEELKSKKSQLLQDIDNVKINKESAEAECEKIKTQIAATQTVNDELLEQLTSSQNALISAEQIKMELEVEYNSLKQTESVLIEKVSKIDDSLNRVKEQIHEHRSGSIEIKENIEQLQLKAGEFRQQVQEIEKEKRQSIIEKHKVEAEFGHVQGMYLKFKEDYESKKTVLDQLKSEIKKKVDVIAKSDLLIPKLEKMIGSLSHQEIFLLKSNENLVKFKETQIEIKNSTSHFESLLEDFNEKANNFFINVEKIELLESQIASGQSQDGTKDLLDLILKSSDVKNNIDVSFLINEYEKLESDVDKFLSVINDSFDLFAKGTEFINKSESSFNRLKEAFENSLEKFNTTNQKFEMFNNKIRELVANNPSVTLNVTKDFILTSLYSLSSDLGVRLEVDDTVVDTVNSNEFRLLYKAIKQYSEVIREVNASKTHLKLFRIKNFGSGHVVMRFENFTNFDLVSVKNTLPILNDELRHCFNNQPLKIAFKGHVDEKSKAFSKLDIIIKHTDDQKTASRKVHVVKSRSSLNPLLNT